MGDISWCQDNNTVAGVENEITPFCNPFLRSLDLASPLCNAGSEPKKARRVVLLCSPCAMPVGYHFLCHLHSRWVAQNWSLQKQPNGFSSAFRGSSMVPCFEKKIPHSGCIEVPLSIVRCARSRRRPPSRRDPKGMDGMMGGLRAPRTVAHPDASSCRNESVSSSFLAEMNMIYFSLLVLQGVYHY